MKPLKASFSAYISNKRNAIGIDGLGGGSITLEFSDSDVAEALKLVAMRNCIVKVEIEVVERKDNPVKAKQSKPKKEKTEIS